MLSWTKEVCFNMYKLSKLIKHVETAEFMHKGNKLTVLSAPDITVDFEKFHEEPLLKLLVDLPNNLVCIQHNPIKTMLRFRHAGFKFIEKYPQHTKPKESFEFELPYIQDWQECRAVLPLHQYLKEETDNPEILVKNMISNIIGRDAPRFPYINDSLAVTMLKKCDPVLIDIPEPLFRMNIVNSYSLDGLKLIYKTVVSNLKKNKMDETELHSTGNGLAHDIFPGVFQKERDLFTLSFLKLLLEKYNITAVVSAPTYVAMTCFWEEEFNFSDFNKALERNDEDSDDNLLEKHAILDAIMNSKCWNEKFMMNRFCYIDKMANISEGKKNEMQETFLKYYKEYNSEMEAFAEQTVGE
ncbi:hypothetical protein SteCoe_16012 [Stentor coeruleus]|uniref:Uncharacterized protein n=1 Tax=Stentor coeruleus TaxID=5963 RepID=A0A1R2C2B0_9CILI|nr:hypothetical protein SteCoe_16012 [Stentor coeruleus]